MSSWAMAVIKEFHKHPVFVPVLAIVLVGYIAYSVRVFALASDVDAVERRLNLIDSKVSGIRDTIQRSSLEQRVHSLEAEIFNLERLASDGGARDLDYERLSRLRSELGTAKRDLIRVN